MRNRFKFFLLLCCAGALSFTPSMEVPDFTGHWGLDNARSDFGGSEFHLAADSLLIQQRADSIQIIRKGIAFNGEPYRLVEHVSLDGTECTNISYGGAVKRSASVWSDDGRTLSISSTIAFEWQGQQNEAKAVETLALGEDDTILNIGYSSQSSFGSLNYKLVYNHQ